MKQNAKKTPIALELDADGTIWLAKRRKGFRVWFPARLVKLKPIK